MFGSDRCLECPMFGSARCLECPMLGVSMFGSIGCTKVPKVRKCSPLGVACYGNFLFTR